MWLAKYLDRNMHGAIDFDTFYLLAVIPRKGKNPIILLAQKNRIKDKYFNLRYGQYSEWYSSIDNLLSATVEYCGFSKFRCWRCRRRYYRLIGGKQNA